MVAALTLYLSKKSSAIYPLFLFFLLLGFIHTGLSLQPPKDPAHISNLIQQKTRATVTGTLTSMVEFNGKRSKFDINVDSLRYHLKKQGQTNQFIKAKGTVRCGLNGQIDKNIQPGATIMLIASLRPTYNYQTPGSFDYVLHMANQSIFVTGQINSPQEVLQIHDHTKNKLHDIRYLPERIRQNVSNFLSENLEQKSAGIYQAILIGSRLNVSGSILENFKKSGCMHLLAISGLHMGLLALMVSALINWLLKRSSRIMLLIHTKTTALLFSILLLLIYAFIAGMNTPVLRAFFMASLMTIAVFLKRQHSLIHIIAAAAIILLTLRPLSLFTASFQLSFSAVVCIALLYPSLLTAFEKQNELETNSEIRSKRFLQKTKYYLKSSFFVSIAATLGTLPFLLFHFNRFSSLSPVTNIVVEPFLCFWTLPIGLVAVPFIYLAPNLALWLFHIGAVGIAITTKITEIAGMLPGASFWTITPYFTEICFYYIIMALWSYRKKIKIRLQVPLLATVALLLLFTKELWLPANTATAKITYLDVGQGSSTCIKLPKGKTILVDGGSQGSDQFNIGERVIAPFLWKERIWSLDGTVITHMHADHYNGMDFIITHFAPKRLYIPYGNRTDKNYRKIVSLARSKHTEIIHPVAGQTESFIPNMHIYWLGMNGLLEKSTGQKKTETASDKNEDGLVFKLVYRDRSFLFPGDIDQHAESLLLAERMNMESDILLSPHHGSISSSSHNFINTVSPTFIIVSAGLARKERYPAADHLSFWKNKGISTLLTSKSGSITVISDGKDYTVSGFKKNILSSSQVILSKLQLNTE